MKFTTHIPDSHKNVALERFGLNDGQFYGVWTFKNLWWTLDGVSIGYGDLTDAQIRHIQDNLREGETFRGFNEHHGTRWQQTELPILHITKDRVAFPHRESQHARRA